MLPFRFAIHVRGSQTFGLLFADAAFGRARGPRQVFLSFSDINKGVERSRCPFYVTTVNPYGLSGFFIIKQHLYIDLEKASHFKRQFQ